MEYVLQKENREAERREDLLKRVKEFIREARSRGYNDDQIKEMFLKKGWSEESVSRIFDNSF